MTHVDHGWRHAPKAQGGTDPIPATGGAAEPLLIESFYSSTYGLEITNLANRAAYAIDWTRGSAWTGTPGLIDVDPDPLYPHWVYMTPLATTLLYKVEVSLLLDPAADPNDPRYWDVALRATLGDAPGDWDDPIGLSTNLHSSNYGLFNDFPSIGPPRVGDFRPSIVLYDQLATGRFLALGLIVEERFPAGDLTLYGPPAANMVVTVVKRDAFAV